MLLSELNQDWQQDCLRLMATGVLSKRKIAKVLKVPKSTLSDFARAYEQFKKTGTQSAGDSSKPCTHLFIPDCQVKPGISLEYLRWIGEYIVRKKPDVVVNAGDFADFPSLSHWDMGKKAAEGKRVLQDIEAVKEGMNVMMAPLYRLQAEQRAKGEPVYSPRLVITLGNHCDRLTRYVESRPELHGFLSLDSLEYEKHGWEVVPFLTPIVINGISYCHYFVNVMTGKPLGGNAETLLKTIGTSFTAGHAQKLSVATRYLQTTGEAQWGLVAGSAYVHHEDYKGEQGQHHWKGIVLKNNVRNGNYDPSFVSMEWLEQEYGER